VLELGEDAVAVREDLKGNNCNVVIVLRFLEVRLQSSVGREKGVIV
jgi:hypothetical protein